VQFALGITRDFDIAHLELVPAEFLEGGDLGVDGVAGFVSNSCEIHIKLSSVVLPQPFLWQFQSMSPLSY
jgi:hypothetical protein